MIAEPWALAERSADPLVGAVANVVRLITEAPWRLGPADRARTQAAGLPDESLVQVVLLSSFFGHLNRVADAVGIELDYPAVVKPPPVDLATPPYLRPPPAEWSGDIQSAAVPLRPGVVEPLAAWRAHALERAAPLDRRQRALIAYAVAERLGDFTTEPAAPGSALDAALVATADEVTLAPWRLGAGTVDRLREAGLQDDVVLFDAIATAAACTTFSRIRVALAALGLVPGS